jgi:hypothetical protein
MAQAMTSGAEAAQQVRVLQTLGACCRSGSRAIGLEMAVTARLRDWRRRTPLGSPPADSAPVDLAMQTVSNHFYFLWRCTPASG